MFLGEFTHTLDEAGRLTIPARFRGELAAGLVITRGLDHCLAIFPMEEWKRLAEKVSALPITDRNARALRRLVFANATDVVPDKQGRILIPPRLREYLGITDDVVIIGLNTYIELWHPDAWREERGQVEGGDSMETWATLGI
ncbi:MAG: division/cell wall cluster transcriptional repressor MraZ [Anaerolineae bacterium]|nr:division/cell wall cluster transcriptional repressor MraZ [Anaerolineae bacterium]